MLNDVPLMLVDGNSISYACFYNNELSANGKNTAVPYTFINSLHSLLAKEFPGYKPIILWDGKSAHRKSIYPEYKENRTAKTPEKELEMKDFAQQRALLIQMLTALGTQQMRAPQFEADDLAYMFTSQLSQPMLLVTSDQDWYQLITRVGISMYKHKAADRELITHSRFEEVAEVKSPQQFVQVKALTGDVSDNITGVGGIGKKTAISLMKEYGSVERFLEYAKDTKPKLNVALSRLVANEPFEYRGKEYPPPLDAFYRNLKLVDLSQAPKITKADIEYQKPQQDLDDFKTLAKQYMMNSWLENFDHWAKPFTQVY